MLHPVRLTLWVLLSERPDAVNMAGPDCAPWGLPARATTQRTIVNVLGRQDLDFVANGNMMISRFLISIFTVLDDVYIFFIYTIYLLYTYKEIYIILLYIENAPVCLKLWSFCMHIRTYKIFFRCRRQYVFFLIPGSLKNMGNHQTGVYNVCAS